VSMERRWSEGPERASRDAKKTRRKGRGKYVIGAGSTDLSFTQSRKRLVRPDISEWRQEESALGLVRPIQAQEARVSRLTASIMSALFWRGEA